MLTYLLVKPGATHWLPQLLDSVNEMLDVKRIRAEQESLLIARDGISLLKGDMSSDPHNDLVYVGTGIVSDNLFDLLYPYPPDGEVGNALRGSMIDQPFGVIIMDPEPAVVEAIIKVKGKFQSDDPEVDLGIRGMMKEKYRDKGKDTSIPVAQRKPGISENFIHSPDTEDEALAVWDFMRSEVNSGHIVQLHSRELRHRGRRNQEFES